jgi:hypothetical protein
MWLVLDSHVVGIMTEENARLYCLAPTFQLAENQ